MKWNNYLILSSLLLLVCVLSGCSNEDYIPITTIIYNNTINNITNNITTEINITNNITNNFTTSTINLKGIINNTIDVDVLETENYYNSPWFGYGCYHNYLLQTEQFATTWVRRNGTVITNDNAISPIGTLIAENVLGNITSTHTYQQVAHTQLNNMTFSVWMRSYNNKGDNVVGLKLYSNNVSFPITETNFTLTTDWKRYNVTTNFYYAHQFVNVSIINGVNNISLWGAQLENGTRARINGAPRTTTANVVETCGAYTRGAWLFQSGITSSGALSGVGVAVGGALSGATTGAFSGTITSTYASTLNNLALYGHIFTSGASTGAIPVQGAPLLSFRTTIWNGTATSNQEYNLGTRGNNLTKETSLVLFNKNAQGFNKTIMNITTHINSTIPNITITWANNTIQRYVANDNTTQFMCLNISQSGNVTAYKC